MLKFAITGNQTSTKYLILSSEDNASSTQIAKGMKWHLFLFLSWVNTVGTICNLQFYYCAGESWNVSSLVVRLELGIMNMRDKLIKLSAMQDIYGTISVKMKLETLRMRAGIRLTMIFIILLSGSERY